MTLYYTHSIRWGNPYTEPPNNLPRLLFEVTNQLNDYKKDEKLARKLNAN
ncbi:hypothetical protein PCC7424_5489 (plasmid) [Gloeothece citriformis PCC 7424]|uniref:Uncharacterized protein n=1 Tax=Gloeothece citriformis (strain PCC 7424) TaxID=65393 RepID=B7KMN7_GLOC7|nr:hypothetical protein [Gloeothece citriformis]ACK74059.1 hypothetical protein PCC7424_5489 [Gloeothece citriformis PCC 7424]